MENSVRGDFQKEGSIEAGLMRLKGRLLPFKGIPGLSEPDTLSTTKDRINSTLSILRGVNRECGRDIHSPIMAAPYSCEKTYEKGDWVYMFDTYWLCIQPVEVGTEWDPEQWERHDDVIEFLYRNGGGDDPGAIKHQDFADVDGLEDATLRQVGTKVNEILQILKGEKT